VSKIWYLAEGKVGAGFTEYLTIVNPDSTNDCSVSIQYLLATGSPVTQSASVPHGSRHTEFVNIDLNTAATSSTFQVHSTIVSVDTTASPNCAGVVAERPMYFKDFRLPGGGSVSSGSDVLGTTHTSTTFYFADVPAGGGFASYITILNPPNGKRARVIATFYPPDPRAPSPRVVTVQPGQRGTIIPRNTGSLRHAAVVVTSNQPVVVETPTYFSNVNEGNAKTVSGASSVVAAQTLAKDWLFAEGYVGGQFQQYLVLANPATSSTTASVTLEYSNGHTQQVSVSLPPKAQAFVDVNSLYAHPTGTCDTSPCQPTTDVSAEITANSNIIAQREMYFHYSHPANGRSLTATGGTNVVGKVGPASSAYTFAEGYTNTNYDEWLTLQNPTTNQETINVTLFNEDGNTYSQDFTVVAHSRFTIDIVAIVLQNLIQSNDTFQGFEVSMVVQSSSSSPFMAERPMYWNTGSEATQGGSDAIGFTL
jgi:hypothetical protein